MALLVPRAASIAAMLLVTVAVAPMTAAIPAEASMHAVAAAWPVIGEQPGIPMVTEHARDTLESVPVAQATTRDRNQQPTPHMTRPRVEDPRDGSDGSCERSGDSGSCRICIPADGPTSVRDRRTTVSGRLPAFLLVHSVILVC